MALYARVEAGLITGERDFADVPPDMTRKGFQWLPITVTDPPFDPATQVRTGPVLTIVGQTVTKVWTVRAMTAGELDAVKDDTINSIGLVLFQIAFNHENRIRALEARAAITATQFRAAIKSLL